MRTELQTYSYLDQEEQGHTFHPHLFVFTLFVNGRGEVY